MRARFSSVLILIFAASCGRSPVGFIADPSRAVGQDASTSSAQDANSSNFDATVGPADAGAPPMDECRVPDDCFRTRGEPICDNGQRGEWACERVIGCLALPCPARCAMKCEPTPPCRVDCDCPFETACVRGMCQRADRRNLCCDNPACPEGDFCQERDGRPSRCDEGPSMCGNDCHCEFDRACINGVCQVANRLNQCCDNPQCPPGSTCIDDRGRPGTCGPNMSRQVGDPCRDDDECGEDSFCIEESDGFRDGYCSNECRSNRDCDGDAECKTVGRDSVCFDGCTGNAECRNGYRCIRLGGRGNRICWPVSDGSSNPNGAPVGQGCAGDQDCARGLSCLMTQGNDFPGGYCSVLYCDSQTNPCPMGSLCRGFGGNFSMCLEPCPNPGQQSTCRQGYRCLGMPGSPEGVCVGN